MPEKPRSGSIWPKAIITYFAIVITGIVLFVGWAVRQNMDLVRKDYYAEELRFQKQMDRVQRTRQLQGEATVAYDKTQQKVTVAIPPEHIGKVSAGVVHLYRPSDAKLDQNIPLALTSHGTQTLNAAQLAPGLWNVRVLWKLNDDEFFFDHSIVVAGEES